MSETLFKFLLKEIQAVRITCRLPVNGQPCGGIVEVPLASLALINRCPVCHGNIVNPGERFLSDLQHALQAIIVLPENRVTVEIVLPGEKE